MIDRPSRPAQRYGFAAFRERSYAFYWASRILATLAIEMQSTAVGWHVYRLTGSELALGLIGLAQFAPFALLFLATGLVADRYSRIRILSICVAIQTACPALFFAMTWQGDVTLLKMLLVLAVFGVARAFMAPVQQSIAPNLVPQHLVANAIAWNSIGLQIARIVGPTIAGLVIAFGAAHGADGGGQDGGGEMVVYAAAGALLVVTLCLTLMVRMRSQIRSREPTTVRTLVAGLRFLWTRQVLFAAVAMDLFAVLFGGATALLPIYARDILAVGELGYGVLSASLELGALGMSAALIFLPGFRRAGGALLVAVAVYGVATIVFGLSRWFPLSVLAYMVAGMADAVSVVLRGTAIQLSTPDALRGRVSSVNFIFIGASNQLGAAESGFLASLTSATFSVVTGGVGCLVVVALVAWRMPALRCYRTAD
jgi:MFS family permease